MVAASLIMTSLLTAATAASSATTSTKEMYGFWCTAARTGSTLCQHHELNAKMAASTDAAEKKTLSDTIRTLMKPPASTGLGAPRTPSPFSKEYQQMKMAYCATSPAGGKTLCATAASQYKTGGATSTKPGSSMSSVTQSYTDVWQWYCAKSGANADRKKLCDTYQQRAAVLEQLRKPGSGTEERKKLMERLKALPATAYATTQGIYADYCKAKENGEKAPCTRLKQTQGSLSMRKWYCEQPGKADGSNWCKRSALIDKLQKIPPTTADAAQAAERKTLTSEYAAYSKPPAAGGPSLSAQIAKEISEAKKAYCAVDANKPIAYCKIPTPMMLPTSPGQVRIP